MRTHQMSWSAAHGWRTPGANFADADLVLHFGSRAVLDRETRSITFAGDIPEGWAAQLMRGNFDRLAAGAAAAARQARSGLGAASDQNGLAVLASCIGRRLLMGQRIVDEVEGAGACQLRNQTMTVTAFTEAA